jgi:hypothetical protein
LPPLIGEIEIARRCKDAEVRQASHQLHHRIARALRPFESGACTLPRIEDASERDMHPCVRRQDRHHKIRVGVGRKREVSVEKLPRLWRAVLPEKTTRQCGIGPLPDETFRERARESRGAQQAFSLRQAAAIRARERHPHPADRRLASVDTVHVHDRLRKDCRRIVGVPALEEHAPELNADTRRRSHLAPANQRSSGLAQHADSRCVPSPPRQRERLLAAREVFLRLRGPRDAAAVTVDGVRRARFPNDWRP